MCERHFELMVFWVEKMVSREAEKKFEQRIVMELVAEKQMLKIGDL